MNINTLRQKIASEEYGGNLVDRLIKSQSNDSLNFGQEDILNMVISDFQEEFKNIFKSEKLENSIDEIQETLELELEELMDIIEIKLEELGYEY